MVQPTPVLLPGESHEGRSLVGYSPWGCKESDMTVTSISLSLSQLKLTKKKEKSVPSKTGFKKIIFIESPDTLVKYLGS